MHFIVCAEGRQLLPLFGCKITWLFSNYPSVVECGKKKKNVGWLISYSYMSIGISTQPTRCRYIHFFHNPVENFMKPVENEGILGAPPATQFAEKTVVAMDLEDW